MRQKLGILCPVEGPPERDGQAFFELHNWAMEGKKGRAERLPKSPVGFSWRGARRRNGKQKDNSCPSRSGGFQPFEKV